MNYRLARADCRRGIPLADQSVQTVVTSPPYWGLRDYGEPGQIGLEPRPEDYVARLVALFRDVRRVLRDDGTVWLNLGDSYNSAASNQNGQGLDEWIRGGNRERGRDRSIKGNIPGLKPKDLVGIPWRVALALQADGWTLRSDIIWSKPNPMPESVTDRPTRAHEYLFLLSKRANYYYDHEAIREPIAISTRKALESGTEFYSNKPGWSGNPNIHGERGHPLPTDPAGRNKRSVWTVATMPYEGAHFATFPPELIHPCIRAGTSEKGQCPRCGDPWVRMVENTPMVIRRSDRGDHLGKYGKTAASGTMVSPAMRNTLGWSSSCLCDPAPPEPQIVLDPFNGAGTTGVVALALGRRYVGLDLSPNYLRLARRRIERPHAAPQRPAPATPTNGHYPLLEGLDP